MATCKRALWDSSSAVASECSCEWTTSIRLTSAWSPLVSGSSRHLAMRSTADLPCFWISRATGGTCWGQTRADKRSVSARRFRQHERPASKMLNNQRPRQTKTAGAQRYVELLLLVHRDVVHSLTGSVRPRGRDGSRFAIARHC